MKIPYNEKNVKFVGKKLIVLFSQCSNIVVKIRDIVGDKRKKKMSHVKIMCWFFDSSWVYIRNKCP
jgi:hypothetical protein